MSEFSLTFSRSGKPGGQNVNKVNSKALVRWEVSKTKSLPPLVLERFLSKYANRLTVDGDLLVTSQKYRDQSANVEDCLDKLCEMIASVLTAPPQRRPTRPTAASRLRRVKGKVAQSKKKQLRRTPPDE